MLNSCVYITNKESGFTPCSVSLAWCGNWWHEQVTLVTLLWLGVAMHFCHSGYDTLCFSSPRTFIYSQRCNFVLFSVVVIKFLFGDLVSFYLRKLDCEAPRCLYHNRQKDSEFFFLPSLSPISFSRTACYYDFTYCYSLLATHTNIYLSSCLVSAPFRGFVR